MRFVGTAYRAHDPAWAFSPLSGAGAAIHGGRFNAKGVEALYLGLDPLGTLNEMAHGFGRRLLPTTLCSYEIDCEDIADLTSEEGRAEHGAALDDMACAWMQIARDGGTPPSWELAERLRAKGIAGILVPSFAVGARADHRNIVLWTWGPELPHRVTVHDPTGRLPRNQLSWR